MPLTLPLMRGGGLHFRVMLCWRGLRTTHTHRPLTTYFLSAKIDISPVTAKYFFDFLQFPRALLCRFNFSSYICQ